MISLRHPHTVLALSVLALCASTAQAEICVQNATQYKVRIIEAAGFTQPSPGSMEIQNEVDRRVLMPQEEYCIAAGNAFNRDATRFAFELIAPLDDVRRRRKSYFNVLQNAVPPINSWLTIKGGLVAPKATVLTNLRPFNYGGLRQFVVWN